jgi:nucleotide-binding universal stress UspA family protein
MKEITMRIMVGYDGSGAAKNALDLAKKHAKAFGAKVYILTSMVKGTERQLEDIEKAEHDLEGIKNFFHNENIPCEIHLLIRGLSPGEDLVQFAKDNDIAEIIVGIEKKSKVEKFVFGSNAQYVILEAPCPVVTIK